MGARLAAEIWVSAQIWKVEAAGAAAYLRRRGTDGAGAVAIKATRTGLSPHDAAATVLVQATSATGGLAWTWLIGPEPATDAAVEAALARQIRFDPDLWILEIEDRDGRPFLDDPIL